jgi:hypothetical protein
MFSYGVFLLMGGMCEQIGTAAEIKVHESSGFSRVLHSYLKKGMPDVTARIRPATHLGYLTFD